jgi:hypothetical protein
MLPVQLISELNVVRTIANSKQRNHEEVQDIHLSDRQLELSLSIFQTSFYYQTGPYQVTAEIAQLLSLMIDVQTTSDDAAL